MTSISIVLWALVVEMQGVLRGSSWGCNSSIRKAGGERAQRYKTGVMHTARWRGWGFTPLKLPWQNIPGWWCEPQKPISSEFPKPQTQDRGVSRVGFFWGLSPWLPAGPRLRVLTWPCSAHAYLLPWGLCVWRSSSCKDTSHTVLFPL